MCYILVISQHFLLSFQHLLPTVGTLHELEKLLLNHYSFYCILVAMLATLCFSLVIG